MSRLCHSGTDSIAFEQENTKRLISGNCRETFKDALMCCHCEEPSALKDGTAILRKYSWGAMTNKSELP